MEAGRGVGWVLRRRQEARGGREALAGRPRPRAAGLIRFVSGPARGCQLSPGQEPRAGGGGAGGRASAVEGTTPPAPLQLLSSLPGRKTSFGFST